MISFKHCKWKIRYYAQRECSNILNFIVRYLCIHFHSEPLKQERGNVKWKWDAILSKGCLFTIPILAKVCNAIEKCINAIMTENTSSSPDNKVIVQPCSVGKADTQVHSNCWVATLTRWYNALNQTASHSANSPFIPLMRAFHIYLDQMNYNWACSLTMMINTSIGNDGDNIDGHLLKGLSLMPTNNSDFARLFIPIYQGSLATYLWSPFILDVKKHEDDHLICGHLDLNWG